MARQIDNVTTSFTLTEREDIEGAKLTLLQKMRIKNKLSAIVEDRLGLELDAYKPNDFFQKEAYLKGESSAYKLLLAESEFAEDQ